MEIKNPASTFHKKAKSCRAISHWFVDKMPARLVLCYSLEAPLLTYSLGRLRLAYSDYIVSSLCCAPSTTRVIQVNSHGRDHLCK